MCLKWLGRTTSQIHIPDQVLSYDLSNRELWFATERLTLFRAISDGSTYEPDAPWVFSRGRFSNGVRSVLYLAADPEVALAEYLRWHPELVRFSNRLRISIYELQIDSPPSSLNVRTDVLASLIPFPFDRLLSSERDETIRYRECRELADDCEASAGGAIAHPSAALQDGSWNVALFGPKGGDWHSSGIIGVPLPAFNTSRLHPIDG